MTAPKLSRSRGANPWTLRVYDALWENPAGLTREQLLDECERRFNRSGTMQWFRETLGDRESISSNKRAYSMISPYRDVVALKMRHTVVHMRAARYIRNLGNRRNPIYAVTDPPNHPRYWKPKTYRPGEFRPYNPAEQRDIGARHALGMRWPAEVRAELARPHPRSKMLITLLEQALDLVEDPRG